MTPMGRSAPVTGVDAPPSPLYAFKRLPWPPLPLLLPLRLLLLVPPLPLPLRLLSPRSPPPCLLCGLCGGI